jgi:hypothetical protein
MKKVLAFAAICACAVAMSGCGIAPMKGNATAAIIIDHVVSEPFVDNSVNPLKHGESKSTGIICFNTGDASIGAAMRNGGINKVHHVDYNVKNILFIYNETITTVYGE